MRDVAAISKTVVALAIVIASAACSKDASVSVDGGGGNGKANDSFALTPASGLISGQSWTMQSGFARASVFGNGDVSLTLGDRAIAAPCGFERSDREVMVSVPAATGTTMLGGNSPMRSLTFVDATAQPTSNLVTVNGKVEITAITETTVEGRVVAEFDSENTINGTFSIPRCNDN